MVLTDGVTRVILVYAGIFTFLVDAYPTFAASALAANSFMRSSFGGIFPLFGIQSKLASDSLNSCPELKVCALHAAMQDICIVCPAPILTSL